MRGKRLRAILRITLAVLGLLSLSAIISSDNWKRFNQNPTIEASVSENVQGSAAMPINSEDSDESSKSAGAAAINVQDIEITYQRIEKNVTNEQGEILGQMYFIKPILKGEGAGAAKINEYFEADSNGFFFGSEKSEHFKEGLYNQFYNAVVHARTLYTDEELKKFPIYNVVETVVQYQSNNYICVLEQNGWSRGGTTYNYNHRYYGITFDALTGDVVPVSQFLNIGMEEFNQNIISLLSKHYESEGYEVNEALLSEQFSENKPQDYEYYYQESFDKKKNIYIIFNNSPYTLDAFVLAYPSGECMNSGFPVKIITDSDLEPDNALRSFAVLSGAGRGNKVSEGELVYESGDMIAEHGLAEDKNENKGDTPKEAVILQGVVEEWADRNNLEWDSWNSFIKTDTGYFAFIYCNGYSRYFLIELNEDFSIKRVSEKPNPFHGIG